jgi:hypothetical protein
LISRWDSGGTDMAADLKIIRVITADSADGQPWPPPSTDNWHEVSRSRGFTTWRAVGLEIPPPGDHAENSSASHCKHSQRS